MSNLKTQSILPALDATPVAPMQKLAVRGHLLPGTDFSTPYLKQLITDLSSLTNMHLFGEIQIKTPEDYDPKTYQQLGNRPPDDINASWMWDDSGGSIYVFPSRDNWCVIDLHTCKDFDTQDVLQFLYERLHFREDMESAEQSLQRSSNWTPDQRYADVNQLPETKYLLELSQILATRTISADTAIKLRAIILESEQNNWDQRFWALFSDDLRNRIKIATER